MMNWVPIGKSTNNNNRPEVISTEVVQVEVELVAVLIRKISVAEKVVFQTFSKAFLVGEVALVVLAAPGERAIALQEGMICKRKWILRLKRLSTADPSKYHSTGSY